MDGANCSDYDLYQDTDSLPITSSNICLIDNNIFFAGSNNKIIQGDLKSLKNGWNKVVKFEIEGVVQEI